MNQRDQIKTWPLFCVLGVVLLLADQWVKWWTVQTFSAPAAGGAVTADAPRPLIDGVVELTRVHNYGAAWSSFSGSRWLLVGVTCAIVAVVAAVLLRRDVRHPLGLAAGTLIIAGGI
ncbi:MAG: signal peptidase II, partial [Dysosmobacter sp.]|uniref:signal peptidase II n=1 Tax=Dysosmobacter sp. TaxID=2591382 RepID=UPI003D89C1CD